VDEIDLAHDRDQCPVAGCYEHSNEPSDCIKGEEFLEWLIDCQLLKKNFAPWS
jgi:hypothetical protein